MGSQTWSWRARRSQPSQLLSSARHRACGPARSAERRGQSGQPARLPRPAAENPALPEHSRSAASHYQFRHQESARAQGRPHTGLPPALRAHPPGGPPLLPAAHPLRQDPPDPSEMIRPLLQQRVLARFLSPPAQQGLLSAPQLYPLPHQDPQFRQPLTHPALLRHLTDRGILHRGRQTLRPVLPRLTPLPGRFLPRPLPHHPEAARQTPLHPQRPRSGRESSTLRCTVQSQGTSSVSSSGPPVTAYSIA